MSGAGNRFWVADFTSSLPGEGKNWPQTAKKLCRHGDLSTPSKTADGLVILLKSPVCDFKWLFYNVDGSPAEMCGNAACCVTDYIFKKNLLPAGKTSFTLETQTQTLTGELTNRQARVFLKQSKNIKGPFEVDLKGEKHNYMFIDSGVPHAVIPMKYWPDTPAQWERHKQQAQMLRNNTSHHKNGMNVTFYFPDYRPSAQAKKPRLFARSFERGVEDFTPACGTGALATAQIHRLRDKKLSLVLVQMPGGVLEVGFPPTGLISLISPVRWEGEIKTPEL